jgi:hypothetical protein
LRGRTPAADVVYPDGTREAPNEPAPPVPTVLDAGGAANSPHGEDSESEGSEGSDKSQLDDSDEDMNEEHVPDEGHTPARRAADAAHAAAGEEIVGNIEHATESMGTRWPLNDKEQTALLEYRDQHPGGIRDWEDLLQGAERLRQCALWMDNLSGQVDAVYRYILEEMLNCKPLYLPPDCTDLIQPVDHSAIGAQMKKFICQERTAFISRPGGFAEWDALSEGMKRVMYTWWIHWAWKRLLARQKLVGATTFKRIFKQKGLTLAINGDEVRKEHLGSRPRARCVPPPCADPLMLLRAQDTMFKLGNDLRQVAYPKEEPPKPVKSPNKRERRNALLEAHNAQLAATGMGFLTMPPMIKAAKALADKARAAADKAAGVADPQAAPKRKRAAVATTKLSAAASSYLKAQYKAGNTADKAELIRVLAADHDTERNEGQLTSFFRNNKKALDAQMAEAAAEAPLAAVATAAVGPA